MQFQFTPLRAGRPGHQPPRPTPTYFNSRPTARGAEKLSRRKFLNRSISIHAPPRGATLTDGNRGNPNVFQFTPLREGRRGIAGDSDHQLEHFNSRPSARGDQNIAFKLSDAHISIHAPPRGATAKDMQFLQIFCSTLTNQHGLTIVPRNLSRLFW